VCRKHAVTKYLESQRLEGKTVSTYCSTSENEAKIIPIEGLEMIEKVGGDDGARTRDLRRDRPAF
jgi:hypothetical protein